MTQSSQLKTGATFCGLALAALLTPAIAGPALAEDSASNASIVRTIAGTHSCELISSGEPCGGETWTLTIQPDGTRILRALNNWASGDSQINLVLRADSEFHITEGFASVYAGPAYYGSGFYAINDGKLTASISGPEEYFTETVEVPDPYSVLLHPISADGWHFSAYDHEQGGEQTVMIYTLGAGGRSVLGAFSPIKLRFIGEEELTVTAGTFDTRHYKFGDDADVWIWGPERIMVKHEYTVNDTRFVLDRLYDQ